MGMAAEHQFHVLAVDDSLVDRKLIERLLRISSFQVTTVDSGSKALEFLGLHQDVHRNSPDHPRCSPNSLQQEAEVNLVITDYCMPGMTGYDLLKKIKESSSLKNIPVVIMSSENVPSRINRCLEEGAEEFFLKPVRLSDVNKLKPHMLKTKYRNHQVMPDIEVEEQRQESSETQDVQLKDPLVTQPQLQQQQQKHQHQQPQHQHQHQHQLLSVQQQQQQPQSNNNKRKTMEEGLSPDRTRRRYSGLTAV